MNLAFEGIVHVSFGQIYLTWDAFDGADLIDSFRGQVNGLCGAAEDYNLTMITGLHTGGVHFSLELCKVAPLPDPLWEEVVEVSCTIDAEEVTLSTLDEHVCEIPLPPGTYRARYCARKMDEGHQLDTYVEGEAVDFYHLALWPAEPAPDVMVKQTSQSAKYWHGTPKRIEG